MVPGCAQTRVIASLSRRFAPGSKGLSRQRWIDFAVASVTCPNEVLVPAIVQGGIRCEQASVIANQPPCKKYNPLRELATAQDIDELTLDALAPTLNGGNQWPQTKSIRDGIPIRTDR